jgi:prepilin-type N-terminal cleavage/methylation domain-containing protein
MKKQKQYMIKRGFTLVEILVVVAITTILTGVGVANYQDIREVNRVVADTTLGMIAIRDVQNKALAPNPREISGFPANEQICAYGVYFVEGSDRIDTYYVSSDPAVATCDTLSSSDFDYASGTQLEQYVFEGSEVNLASGNDISLWFETPFARGGSDRLVNTGDTFDVTIANTRDVLKSRIIRLSPSGLVRIVN